MKQSNGIAQAGVIGERSLGEILSRFDVGERVGEIAEVTGYGVREVQRVLTLYGRIPIDGGQHEEDAIELRAEQRHRAKMDAVGHSSVQPWSAGPLFPCIIARVERYEEYTPFEKFRAYQGIYGWSDAETRRNYEGCRATWYALRPLAERLRSVSYLLISYGRREEYATREDAEQVARALNAHPSLRDAWVRRDGSAKLAPNSGRPFDQRARDAGAA